MKRTGFLAVMTLAAMGSLAGCSKKTPPAAGPVQTSYTQAAIQAGGVLNSDGTVTNANGSITQANGTVIPANQANPNMAAGSSAAAPASGGTMAPAPGFAPAAPGYAPAAPGYAPAATGSAPAATPEPVAVTAPAGTAVTIRTTETLSASADPAGSRFTGALERPVVSHGAVVFERGTPVSGEVVGAKRKGEFKGAGDLSITLTSIGRTPVRTSEYTLVNKGRGKRTGAMIGGGGGLGALIGGLAGGGKGALIGGLAGAGAGTAASTTGSKDVVIRSESVITFRLRAPVSR